MKPKILYIITQSEFGGAQRYVFDLVNNLNREFEILVAIGENPRGDFLKNLANKNINTIFLKYLKREINPIYDLLAFFELHRLIKKEKPDIIHLNSTKAGFLGSLAARFAYPQHLHKNSHHSYQIIYAAHGWVFNEPLGWIRQKIYLLAEKWSARFKDKIICVSEHDRQIAAELGFPENKLITIHNGIDIHNLNFLTKEKARCELFSEIPPSPLLEKGRDGKIFIGTIANLYPTKGIKYLIEAVALIFSKKPLLKNQLYFCIIGEGQERNKLEYLINKYQLTDNFFLLGHKPSASRYLKAFDVFVLPSVKEGFPYTILEAITAKIPIIATKVGGVPEIIFDRQNGLLAQSKNSQDLAEKIIELIDNQELRNTLSQKAMISAEKFSFSKMIDKTKDIYYKYLSTC